MRTILAEHWNVCCVVIDPAEDVNTQDVLAKCVQDEALLPAERGDGKPGDPPLYCVQLDPEIGPELWTEKALASTVARRGNAPKPSARSADEITSAFLHAIDCLNRAMLSGRSLRQQQAADWARRAFGARYVADLPERGLRVLEETIEAYQATGGKREMAHKMVDYVFGRPAGDVSQEIGAIGLTLLIFADAAQLSAEQCEQNELARVLAKPVETFARRFRNKRDLGLSHEPETPPELTKIQRVLLNWLGSEDFQQYGECHGADLDRLIELGLAQIHTPGTHQTGFIAQDWDGTKGDKYRAVSLTEAGRKLIS
jgi:hypothetical protein